jgi:N-acyl-D-aspartate/D-glutamate deacylase
VTPARAAGPARAGFRQGRVVPRQLVGIAVLLGVSSALLPPALTYAAQDAAAPSAPDVGDGQRTYDVVILNGRVMDPESGLDAVRHIGIRNGTIAVITTAPIDGRDTLDARGLVVAPGFIDLNQESHSPEAQRAKVLDGVTAAFRMGTGVLDIDEWYDGLDGQSLLHFGASTGHPLIRMAVLTGSAPLAGMPAGEGASRNATPAEIDRIRNRVRHGLERGALGVAVSPKFTPGATPWEILEMFRAAAEFTGAPVHALVRWPEPVDQHWLELGEVILGAVVSGAPLHVMQAENYGRDAPRLFEMIDAARARGLDVTTEAYPYNYGMGHIETAAYDDWESWPDEDFARRIWPVTGERMTRESFGRYRALGGLILVEGRTEAAMGPILASPLTMIISLGDLQDGVAHPRLAGSYARVLGHYVREQGLLTLMDALRKMTLLPAQRLEARAPAMRNKGRIREGADADITIFDPLTVLDRATVAEPLLPSAGIRYVLVNGVVVVNDGVLDDGVAPGRAIRAPMQAAPH